MAAGGPDAFDGEIRFHRRLTVLVDERSTLAAWVASLIAPRAPADTLLEIDDAPARTYDLPRALRELPVARPFDVEALRALAVGKSASPGARPSAAQLTTELERWQSVLLEARHRLSRSHELAPHVDPVDLAAASRLRNEWRYAEHVDASEHTRDTRCDAQERRERFDLFLDRFGAASFEDLSMVGTGFGDTRFDAAIREAAMVVSMAEQRCHKLRMDLDVTQQREASTDEGPDAADTTCDDIDLGELEADRVDTLLARGLAEYDDTAYVRPLVVDRVLDVLAPTARRRAYDRLVTHARRRQIVLITANGDVERWAAHESPHDAALRLGLTTSTPRR